MEQVIVDVRPGIDTDASQVAELLRAASLPLDSVGNSACEFLIARAEGKIVGAIAMEEYADAALLRSLVVDPPARRTGAGAALVHAFMKSAARKRKRSVYLLTTDAEGFFERFGFGVIATDEIPVAVRSSGEFAGCCAAGASAMRLELDDAGKPLPLKAQIREKYGEVAKQARAGNSCCAPSAKTQVTRDLYDGEQQACLPTTAINGSRGCGSPTNSVEMRPGDTVLDLGSGAGADVFLAASRVGASGKVYGLDMTEEMVELARAGQRELGLKNVEFLLGEMEEIPLPDKSVDVIVSNCVISLVEDKDVVFGEIFRVLRPGGRISLSDIVSSVPIPDVLRADLNLWLGCLGGALEQKEYERKLARAGFTDASLEITRVYDLPKLMSDKQPQGGSEVFSRALRALASWEGKLFAATVRARRPNVRASVSNTVPETT